jgi:hypothetical protein
MDSPNYQRIIVNEERIFQKNFASNSMEKFNLRFISCISEKSITL